MKNYRHRWRCRRTGRRARGGAAVGLEPTVLERRAAARPRRGAWITVGAQRTRRPRAPRRPRPDVRALGAPSRTNSMFGATGPPPRRRHVSGTPCRRDGGPDDEAVRPRRVAPRRCRRALRCTSSGAGPTSCRWRTRRAGRCGRSSPTGPRSRATSSSRADGVRSRTRRMVDPACPRGAVRRPDQLRGRLAGPPTSGTPRRPGTGGVALRLRATVLLRRPPAPVRRRRVVRQRPAPDRARRAGRHDDEQWRAVLADLVADDAGPAAALVAAGSLELAGDSTYDLPHVPTWWRGRTVLVGDAAHAPARAADRGRRWPSRTRSSWRGRSRPRARGSRSRRTSVPAGTAWRRWSRRGAQQQRQDPGRVGRVLVETMLAGVFRSGVAAKAVLAQTSHRLGREVPTRHPRVG